MAALCIVGGNRANPLHYTPQCFILKHNPYIMGIRHWAAVHVVVGRGAVSYAKATAAQHRTSQARTDN